MTDRQDCYLGDGVYASFDGFGIVLDLRAQDHTTKIFLEPRVFDALVQYSAAIDKATSESNSAAPSPP